MQIVSLHRMSRHIFLKNKRQFAWNVKSYFLEKKKKEKNITNLLSARELTQIFVKVRLSGTQMKNKTEWTGPWAS